MTVDEYIRANWHRAIYRDEPGTGFGGVDLPYRYSSASIKGEGRFYFFFYWDTYFTNPGLLAHGHTDIARENIQNILWLIDRQGYMPNHVGVHNRSQPPYLCRMVEDFLRVMVAARTPSRPDPDVVRALTIASGPAADPSNVARDRELHRTAHAAYPDLYEACAAGIRREYQFWTTARVRPSGLAGYGHHTTGDAAADFYDRTLVRRLGAPADAPHEEKVRVGSHHLGEAESGWDFCQRFSGRCLEHSAVDLNALLHGHERFLSFAADELGWGMRTWYEERAAERAERLRSLMWDPHRNWFFDFDERDRRRSDVQSLAGITPLFTGLATQEEATALVAGLTALECEHGIAVTEEREGCRSYQWAYPNVWPGEVFRTVFGLARYGQHEDAARIARTFVSTTDALYEQTGMLWEKTDSRTGSVAGGEYEAVPMLGWTAGTYVALSAYLSSSLAR